MMRAALFLLLGIPVLSGQAQQGPSLKDRLGTNVDSLFRSASGNAVGLFAGLHSTGRDATLMDALRTSVKEQSRGFHLGLGLGQGLQLLVNYNGDTSTPANTDSGATTLRIAEVDALARFFVLTPARSPLRLFMAGGVTGRWVGTGRDFDDLAPAAGAGLYLKFLPRVAFTASALWTYGKVTSLERFSNRSSDDLRATDRRVLVGASLFLAGK